MKREKIVRTLIFVCIVAVIAVFGARVFSSNESIAQEKKSVDTSKLLVVWTSGDREVAQKMVFMYTLNAKKQGWFDQVRLLIWGPSSRLISEDKELQEYLAKIKDAGVELQACKACSDMYGVSQKLTDMGVDVKYMGKPLTEMLKSDWVTLTF